MDPLGDTLRIAFNKGFLGLGGKREVTYNNGSLTNKDGSAYTGKVKGFLNKTVNAVNKTASGKEGSSMVNEIQNSTSTITIVKSHEGNSYQPSTNTLKFDPSSREGGLNTTGSRERPTFLGLAHEMAHSLDDIRSTLDMRQIPGQNFTYAEQFATHIENQIRAEHLLPLRQYYAFDATTGAGIYPLINNAGQSLLYNNYDYYRAIQPQGVNAPLPTANATLINAIPTINIKIK